MIERLRGHLMRSRLSNLEGRVMNGEALDFEDSSFDAAVSLFGVCSFDDRKSGLAEMFRVVVPGGRVAISSWAPPERNSLLGVALTALRQAVPELSDAGDPQPMHDAEQCARELEELGFEQVATQPFEKTLRFASVDAYWRDFERSSAALVVLKERLGVAAYAEAMARTRTALLTTCGEDAFELKCCAILTFGERPLSAA
jgi:ubiquinone/menaquinone biosynthesis C-methylase UbiE